MRYFAFQGNDYDCGFASVKMLLCHAHRSARFLQLAKPPNRRDRYSYRDLLEIAQQNGVTLVAYKLIDKEEISKLRKFPILLSLKNVNNSLHLVLLRKIRGQRVYYDDPRQGQSVMNYDDFINRWDGSFMQISKVVKVRNLNKEKPILETKKRWTLILLQASSSLFALIGFAFVSSQSYFLFPLLFMVLFVVSELMFRRYQFAVLQDFDHRYLARSYDDDKAVMRKKYNHYFEFKKVYFLFPQILIGSSIICLFALTILAINDLRHLLFLSVIILFAFVDFLISKHVDDKQRTILEQIEEKTFDIAMSKKEVIVNYEHMSHLAHFIAKNTAARKYIGFFLLGASALTYAAISKEATLNFFLFHFFIYVLFYENIGKLLSSLFRLDDFKRKSAVFKDEFVR